MKLFRTLLLSVAAIAATLSASASYNRIIIERTDGSNIEFDTEEIEKIDFGTLNTDAHVLIYNADGTVMRIDDLLKLFIAPPAEDGKSTGFAFGTYPDPATVEDLWQGKYAFGLSLSSSALYTDDVNLVDNPSAVLTRYTYADGELTEATSALTSGTVTTAVNTKNRKVTMNIDATFEDGMRLVTKMDKRPTTVESIDMLTPPEEFSNELIYYNMDGAESLHGTVVEVTRGKYNKLEQFTLKAESNASQGVYYTATIQIAEELIGNTFNFSEAPSNSINFRFENIQVSGPNDQYRNEAQEATGLVKDNGDGTWTIEFDVTNKYKAPWGTGVSGTPERVVIYYTGAIAE